MPTFVALIAVRADKNANFIQGELISGLATERFKCLYCGSNVRRESVKDRRVSRGKCKMPGCRTNDPKVNKNYCRDCKKVIAEREKAKPKKPKKSPGLKPGGYWLVLSPYTGEAIGKTTDRQSVREEEPNAKFKRISRAQFFQDT
jgi:hypothetical protein